MRVIVFGASGIQGAAQVNVLARAKENYDIVAVSRSPKPLTIAGKKIETVSLDFTDHDAVASLLKNADRILLNLPSTSFNPSPPIIAAVKAIAMAAKKGGVGLIVFNTSMPVAEVKQDIKAQDDRREMRDILRESVVPVISIQPVCYLDNLLEGWALPPIRDNNTVRYCHKPDLDVSWICHHDVAQLMVSAMNHPQLAGRDIPVGGAETVRLPALTEKLSRAWKRDLTYDCQTVADFCDKISKTMEGRGLDNEKIVKQMFKAYTYYNESDTKPFVVDMQPVLKELEVELTPIEEWARLNGPEGWVEKGKGGELPSVLY
ncbi:NAD(P)-binding protein [Tothia fuscella]|uniref:NAD(P)-binding protein n=1 Tax=Tothia fuscella TaxID=1048955 RepID=A0A9P4NHJ0_9PEZI|nr:NAD(P)-binding protein [Tothia fuscella]